MKKFKRKSQPKPKQALPNGEVLRDGWNVGGTLHRCTLQQWRAATFGNALATCADWVLAIVELEGNQTPTGGTFRIQIDISDPDVYLLYCWELYQTLNHAAARHKDTAPEQEMHKLAMGAATALRWLKVEVITDGAG